MYSSTISSELDAEQWLTSWTGWFNQRAESLNRRLGGSQSWSGHLGVGKNLFSPQGLKPHTIQSEEKTLY
jgi:hypothetical protein